MTTAPDRRGLIKLSLLGGLAAATATRVGAQAVPAQASVALLPARPIPVVETRFPHEIAPGVFLLPDRRIPPVSNIGIVVGRDWVLVVDCGMGTGSAEKVLALARRLAPGRQVIPTVTHAHPEHGFSARVFKGAGRIWYNRLQADHMARDGQRLLTGCRSGVLSPDLRPLLDDVVRWERVLADIAAMRPKVIVPGHGNLGGAEVADEVRTYLREVRLLAQAGDADAARIRATRPTWENTEFIYPALAYYAQTRP